MVGGRYVHHVGRPAKDCLGALLHLLLHLALRLLSGRSIHRWGEDVDDGLLVTILLVKSSTIVHNDLAAQAHKCGFHLLHRHPAHAQRRKHSIDLRITQSLQLCQIPSDLIFDGLREA